MTDQPTIPSSPPPPRRRPPITGQVAKKRRPVRQFFGDFRHALRRLLTGDPLATFLAFASLAVVITFFLLLGAIGPSTTGQQIPLSRVTALARERQIAYATLLDHDSYVNVTTFDGAKYNAAYLSSGAQTQQLINEFAASGAVVSVDQQTGKGDVTIVVQFMLPILLLVCLFALFMRLGQDDGAGGLSAFSNFAGGNSKRKGNPTGVTFADIAGV